jgi:glutaminase
MDPTDSPAPAAGTAASPIQAFVDALHARFAGLADGRVADYIPELAKADPSKFGIAIATVDGRVYEAGDTRAPFTIQSISKPLVYGVALEDRAPSGCAQASAWNPAATRSTPSAWKPAPAGR